MLPKILNLNGVENLNEVLDLTKTYINPKYDTCKINLSGSEVEKILIDYSKFNLFFFTDYPISYPEKVDLYKRLLKVQKENQYIIGYEKLDKEFREFKYTDPGSNYGFMGHVLNWIDKKWWGYGYDKTPVVWNVLLIYILLSLINAPMLKYLSNNVYCAEKIYKWRNEVTGSKLSILIKSIPFSFFYTALIFFGLRFEIERLNFIKNLQGWRILNITYFFVMYLIGLACLFFLINFAIKL